MIFRKLSNKIMNFLSSQFSILNYFFIFAA